jgi:hypothetical protein
MVVDEYPGTPGRKTGQVMVVDATAPFNARHLGYMLTLKTVG